MRNIVCGFIIVLCLGCAKKTSQPEPAPTPSQPIVVNPPQQPSPIVYTQAYMRGYNDGYAGNWLAPLNWTFINEYRAGWTDGNRDMKKGLPNKLR